jgi:hydrogenase maturation factor
MRVLHAGDDGVAVCDAGEVLTDLVGPLEAGDVVLVHAGVAIARVDR